MKEYFNPILNKKEKLGPRSHEPKAADMLQEQVRKERVFQLHIRQRRQEMYDRYIRWLKRENPMVDAMGRMVMGDVTRRSPDPTFRLRRRHYLSQKWQELRLRNSPL